MALFYRPRPQAAAADFIPFYWRGDYHLFYLEADRSGEAPEGTPWVHLVTRDFVNFENWGIALGRGAQEDQDLYPFTGSVIERQGVFHIFYTGHNPHFAEQGKPQEAIMRATSTDLRAWRRDPTFRLLAPTEQGYEPHDWRDPFVFWNQAAGEYWMLLAARRANPGPPRWRGLTALAASQDLEHWEVRDPFWAPDEFYTHECPDLFRIGEWWYLVFSEFSEACVTRYRMSRSLRGPWLAPANDTFDGRAYYAAKTAGDGEQRFAFGWLPDREGEKDEGAWMWGGNLVVHEIQQAEDGSLTVRCPEPVRGAFRTPVALSPRPRLGPWAVHDGACATLSGGRFSVLTLGPVPSTSLIETKVTLAPGIRSCGLLLRAADDLTSYYQVRLEPPRQRLVVDRWPRPGDQPVMVERRFPMRAERPISLRVLVDGTCLVVYAGDEVALSCRMYDHPEGQLGLFVAEGDAEFRGTTVRGRSGEQ